MTANYYFILFTRSGVSTYLLINEVSSDFFGQFRFMKIQK